MLLPVATRGTDSPVMVEQMNGPVSLKRVAKEGQEK